MKSAPPDALWHRWRERVDAFLREKGFETFYNYLEARPESGLRELADELRVAPVHIECLIYSTLSSVWGPSRAAKEALYRSLRDLEEGWPTREFSKVKLIAMWSSGAMSSGLRQHSEDLHRIASALMEADVAPGWKPSSVEDPVLSEIFGCGFSSSSP